MGEPTSPEFDAVVALVREAGWLRRPEASAAELRAVMEEGVAGLPLPDGVTVTPVDAGGVPGEWVRAGGAVEDAALLYLHGGGYFMGSPATHRGLTARLSRDAGLPVLALDYGLGPERPHPAAVEDASAAYEWMLGTFAPGRLAIAGDSAGGGLTLATLLRLRDSGVALPAAAVLISPFTDLTFSGASWRELDGVDPMLSSDLERHAVDWFLAGADPRDPYASPVFGDPTGLPPMLVHVGEVEMLRDDATRVASRAAAAGVEVELEVWPGMIHVWHAFGDAVPESAAATARVGEYLRARLVTSG